MNCDCGYYYIRHVCYNCGSVQESNALKGIVVWVPPLRYKNNQPKSNSPNVKKRRRIFDRDGNRCLKCSFTPSDLPRSNRTNWLTLDHVVPKSKGGSNSDENLQTLCRICNHEKGNKNCNDYRNEAHNTQVKEMP